MSQRKIGRTLGSHWETFLHLSQDAIWCYELTSPMPLSLSVEEQVNHLYRNTFVKDCNLAAARLYGFQTEVEMIGREIREFLPLPKDLHPIRRFVLANFSEVDVEYKEVHPTGKERYFLMNVYGEVEEGHLIRYWGIQKEITSTKESENQLKGLLRFTESVNRISQLFMATKSEDTDSSIEKALEILGGFSNASRAFVAEISPDRTTLSVTSEWLFPGIPSLIGVGKKLPISKLNPERLGVLAGNGSIDILDTSLLLAEPWHITLFSHAKVRSIFVVGLKDEGRLIGIIGITSYQEVKEFTDEAKQLLSVVSGLVSQVIVRAKNELKLRIKEKALQRFYFDIKEDLALAKVTQEAWVTSDFPSLPGVTIHSRFLPYEQIGGDLILCEKSAEGSLMVLFGDISGHGISAALVSGIVAVTFKKYAKGNFSPSEILRHIHLELSPWVHKHHISACLFQIGPVEKTITFSFAGHPPALTWNQNLKEISLIRDEMYPILLMEEWEGKEFVKTFQEGDRILFYSDGIYELEEEGLGYLGLDDFISETTEIIKSSETSMDIFKQLILNCLVEKDRIIHDDIAILLIEF
ncbi:MAG: SpoIIE family protein phosphatase [Leptospira sp.]|nr:SpoIIE family protein phosphatase [Leptospira sp.]